MPSPEEPTDAQLARIVLRALAGVVALLLATGVATAVGRVADDGGGRDESAEDVVVGAGNGLVSLSPRGGIGPLPGTAVPRYTRSRADPLRSVPKTGRRAAVVSFSEYETVDAARE